ncbi:MAG: TldD/PmbA family protein, partial [Chitinivibrionales bacterium]|nr:TldD/PmbA family protein [Chitinivibrionales bacterium]
GGSFVTLNDFGSLRYGSEKLTVSIFDGIENSPGTFGYDDEGSAQHTYLLIDKGILVNAISSRSSIALANQYAGKQLFTASGATARANNFYRAPLERMSNLNIRPGTDGTLADIIASTENGLIMDNPVSWSIGSNREHFHFSCELAWEVKNGQKTGIVKNASYQGHTLQLYNNLSAVGDASTWQVEQVDNCGKGEPNQEIELGHGVPVLKFENVVCGEVR